MADYTWHKEGDYCSGIDCDSPASAKAICHHLQANNVHCSFSGNRVSFGGHAKFMEVIRICEPFIGKQLKSTISHG